MEIDIFGDQYLLQKQFSGKGGVNVIIVDGDYERSSSSVEDEAMPTANSNSTGTTENAIKKDLLPRIPSPVSPVPFKKEELTLKPAKTEIASPVETVKQMENQKGPLWVKISLDKLDLRAIPALRRTVESKMPWLLEAKAVEPVRVSEEKKSEYIFILSSFRRNLKLPKYALLVNISITFCYNNN